VTDSSLRRIDYPGVSADGRVSRRDAGLRQRAGMSLDADVPADTTKGKFLATSSRASERWRTRAR